MYKVKPTVKSRSVDAARRAKQQAQDDNQAKSEAIDAKESAHKEQKKKMHSEMILSNKDISGSLDKSSERISKILSDISNQVGLTIEVPELVEGDKIADSIEDSSDKIETILKTVTQAIAQIKLETQKPLDISPQAKSLTDAISKNMGVLKSALTELNQSVMEIRLESNPTPIEWEFEVHRNSNKLIEKVTATATDYMEVTYG